MKTKLPNRPLFDGDKQTVYNRLKTTRVMAMTLCVAALCEDRQAIVCVADRLLTAFFPDNKELRHEGPIKIFEPTEWFSVLCAGDTSVFVKINNGVMNELLYNGSKYTPTMESIIQLHYDVFSKMLREKGAFDTHFIVAGYDYLGGHIYHIDWRGSACYNQLGFVSIGENYETAAKQFNQLNYDHSDNVLSTMHKAYIVKRTTEASSKYIGKRTDMLVNCRGKQRAIRYNTKILKLLKEFYKEREMTKDRAGLNIRSQKQLKPLMEELFR